MDCKTVRECYDPTSETMSAVTAHVLGCDACQAYVNELRQLRSLLASDPPVPVPRDFDIQLQRRLERARRNPLYWWRLATLRYALPIAAMVLMAVAALMMVNRPNDVSKPTSVEQAAKMTTLATQTSEPMAQAEGSAVSQPNDAEEQTTVVNESDNWNMAALPESPADLGSSRVERRRPMFLASPNLPVILRVRDDLSQQERLVTIPAVVFGAEPILASMTASQRENENVY